MCDSYFVLQRSTDENTDSTTYEAAYTICETYLTTECATAQLSVAPNGTNVTTVIEDCALDVMVRRFSRRL